MVLHVGSSPGVAWERVTYGVWSDEQADLVGRLRGWALALPPSAAFTHLTGAAAYGWWLPCCPPPPVFVALPSSAPRSRRPGLKVSRHPQAVPVRLVDGVRVTEPAEVLLAAARDLAVLDLVVLVDCALARQDVTLADLERTTRRRRRGAPDLRAVLRLADARSESP